MKYVLIIGDGMADDPLEQLDGKTPLEVRKNSRLAWRKGGAGPGQDHP